MKGQKFTSLADLDDKNSFKAIRNIPTFNSMPDNAYLDRIMTL